jgi:zinc finger protein
MADQVNPIGDKVDKFDKAAPAAAVDGVDGADGEDERVVEEIESLCMNCEENVSRNSSDQVTASINTY